MNDPKFNRFLHGVIYNQSRGKLPFPPATKDHQLHYLELAARYLCPTYQLDWHMVDWYEDEWVKNLCARFPEEWRSFNLGRKQNLYQLLKLVERVPGDTVECGTFKGASSWLIMNYIKPSPDGGIRKHYIFDSFEGLSEPDNDDSSHWVKGALSCGEETVRMNLREFKDRLTLYKGWIPDRFQEVADRKFAFVHVDVDLAQPTLASIEFFYPRLERGGVLVCDDYGSSHCPGATKSIDEFLKDKPESMVGLSTSGGFLVKSGD